MAQRRTLGKPWGKLQLSLGKTWGKAPPNILFCNILPLCLLTIASGIALADVLARRVVLILCINGATGGHSAIEG